jgi:NAD(P)-dependent dehydrogenase (short-subunit alcohol dehydrogenase family)
MAQNLLQTRRCCFHYTDVSNWTSVLTAFEKVFEEFGSIDVVFANAGVHSFEDLLEDNVDDTGHLCAPSTKSLEINLFGVLYTTKAAIHFFKRSPKSEERQLILTGSAAR